MAVTMPPAPAPAPAAAVAPVVMNGCSSSGPAYTRPYNFALSCDSSDLLVRLTWKRWTTKGASGHGYEGLNDCLPDCAQGKYRIYPVHVNFWGLAPVSGHPGERRYTGYSLTYTKTVPRGLNRHRTGRF